MANIFQVDIAARFPTHTLTLTTDGDMTICVVKDVGNKQVAGKKTLDEQDAILSCRAQLGIRDSTLALVTLAQQATTMGQQVGQQSLDVGTGVVTCWNGAAWV